MSWWIGTYFAPLVGLCDAVYVEADDRETAAEAIAATFAAETEVIQGGEVIMDRVFVILADDYVVYDVGLAVLGLSKLQCCGGNGWTADGHSGHCPVKRGETE